jgi:hypothetical protein
VGLAADQGLSADKVHFTTIPVAGTPTITDAAGTRVAVVEIDNAAVPSFIAQVLGQPDSYTQAKAAAPDTVTVQVINGTGRPGLAASSSAALTKLGFHVDAPSNGPTQAATTITYPAGKEAQAKAVAAHVPGATVTASAAVRRVTLTLGSQGGTVGSSSPAATPSEKNTPSRSTPSQSAPSQSTASPGQAFNGASCIN